MNSKVHIFKRKAYESLLEWKNRSKGSTAILVEGARRVGKSTLVRQFVEAEYESFIFIDFSKVGSEIRNIFDDLSNLNDLFTQLQFLQGVKLFPGKSAIVFDEVQFNPKARQAIKHLVEDGRFHYIETGSLISIHKNIKDILIPSEEEVLKMYPMDYEEFKWALGDKAGAELLRELARHPVAIGQAAHRKQMRDFRLYMLVGGMPQAVATYLDTLDLASVDRTKRTILKLYHDDMRKIDDSGRMGQLFDAAPAQLARNVSRYAPYSVVGQMTKPTEDRTLSKLAESMIVNFCYHTTDPSNGLAMDINKDYFKMFVADTGLFVSLAFLDKDFTDNTIYAKLLSDKLDANLGYVYENMAAQILVATGRRLFYYTFYNEGSRHVHKVDFLITDGSKIDPIEVKSSSHYSRHISLDKFCEKFSSKINHPLVICTKDVYKSGVIQYLPIYLLPFIDSYIAGK